MKKVLAGTLILFSFIGVSAQTMKHKTTKTHKTAQKRTIAQKQSKQNIKSNSVNLSPATTYFLRNSSSNTAKVKSLSISDPTILSLNMKANGGDVDLGKSSIVGMPKRYYGIAKGHIFFKSSDATSTGANTGSGSVGTGSSVGSIGTGPQLSGVNGKSSYAAPDIYGIPGIRPPQTTTNDGKRKQ